jgi:hypothetical protein
MRLHQAARRTRGGCGARSDPAGANWERTRAGRGTTCRRGGAGWRPADRRHLAAASQPKDWAKPKDWANRPGAPSRAPIPQGLGQAGVNEQQAERAWRLRLARCASKSLRPARPTTSTSTYAQANDSASRTPRRMRRVAQRKHRTHPAQRGRHLDRDRSRRRSRGDEGFAGSAAIRPPSLTRRPGAHPRPIGQCRLFLGRPSCRGLRRHAFPRWHGFLPESDRRVVGPQNRAEAPARSSSRVGDALEWGRAKVETLGPWAVPNRSRRISPSARAALRIAQWPRRALHGSSA